MLIQILTLSVLWYNRIWYEVRSYIYSKGQKLQETAKTLLIALLFLVLVTQNNIHIQGHNTMDLSFLLIFRFTKFYFLRNNGVQITSIQKKSCRIFLEVITSTVFKSDFLKNEASSAILLLLP